MSKWTLSTRVCDFYILMWQLDLIEKEDEFVHTTGLNPSAELWDKVCAYVRRMKDE